MSVEQSNIKRVQDLVGEFMKGNPEGYMAGVADDIKGSVLGGLIDKADSIVGKSQFKTIMDTMGDYMEVQKFEPHTWRALRNEVFFQVDWVFVWKATGEKVETTALVRKVLNADGNICEKYHMIDHEVIEKLNPGKPLPHDLAPIKRVQELLKEYMEGNAPGYMAGVSPDFKGSVLGGVIPKADNMTSKADFLAVMGQTAEYMEVKKFEPYNYRALPDDAMMFAVDWEFVFVPTGKLVQTTALVRKVVKDNMLCEKYHLVDAEEITGKPSPRDVINGDASA